MIENILIFMRNCVMAVLTAWAGIQIAENVQARKTDTTPVAAASTAKAIKTSDDGANCPHKGLHPEGAQTPNSAAETGTERVPNAQPSVMTIR